MAVKVSILIILLLFLNSCTKTEIVRFHGRVTYKCNGEPAGDIKFNLTRYYDTGSDQADHISEFRTHSDGTYDFTAEVSQKGVFSEYKTYLINDDVWSLRGGGQTKESSTNVEINCSVISADYFKCHIKNLNPYNSNDNFLYLEENTGPFPVDRVIENLTGSNIDTIIYFFTDPESRNLFKYSYRKNNITYNDTISFTHLCFDTIPFELNY